MPIKPENKAKYPKDWKQIRNEILDRAQNRCEGSPDFPDCRAENYKLHPVTGSRVILTIAHLDHDETSDDRENLRAWCQRCHLNYDLPHHQQNAYATRRDGKAIDMFDPPPREVLMYPLSFNESNPAGETHLRAEDIRSYAYPPGMPQRYTESGLQKLRDLTNDLRQREVTP